MVAATAFATKLHTEPIFSHSPHEQHPPSTSSSNGGTDHCAAPIDSLALVPQEAASDDEVDAFHPETPSLTRHEPETPPGRCGFRSTTSETLDSGYYSRGTGTLLSGSRRCQENDDTPSKPGRLLKRNLTAESLVTQPAKDDAEIADAECELTSQAVCGTPEYVENPKEFGRGRHDSLFSVLPFDGNKAVEDDDETYSSSSLESSEVDTEGSVSCSRRPSSPPSAPLPRLLGFDDQINRNDEGGNARDTILPFRVSRADPRHEIKFPGNPDLTKLFDLPTTHPLPSREAINAHFERPIITKPVYWRFGDSIDGPRLLQQKPCLQCVVKLLPCDEGMPSCARCRRAGHGPCLVQRELLAEERWRIGFWAPSGDPMDPTRGGYTVLVRLKTDDEDTWAQKKALEVQLLGYLQDKCDQANWVLPVQDVECDRNSMVLKNLARRRMFEVDFVRGYGSELVPTG